MATNEWINNFYRNQDEIAKGYPKVKIVKVYEEDESDLDCNCELCDQEISYKEFNSNCGICDRCCLE